MGDIRWYKRDPNAALAGFAVLTLEERGAYDTVLDLIYAHQGDLNDDDHYLAGWMRSDVRVWRRLRKRLIGLGKLYVHAGKLRNGRADREIEAAQHRIAAAAAAGLKSAALREARKEIDAAQLSPLSRETMRPHNSPKLDALRNNIRALQATPVERTFQLPTPTKKITPF